MSRPSDLLEQAIERDLFRAIHGVVNAYSASLASKGIPSLPHVQRAAVRALGFTLGALEGADQFPCPCGSCTPEKARASRTSNRRELVRRYREGIAEGTTDALALESLALRPRMH